jgi:hypothetical protein
VEGLVNYQLSNRENWKQKRRGLGQSPSPSIDYIGEKRGEGLGKSPSLSIENIGNKR